MDVYKGKLSSEQIDAFADRVEDLENAIEALPDGTAVTETVAEHTIKIAAMPVHVELSDYASSNKVLPTLNAVFTYDDSLAHYRKVYLDPNSGVTGITSADNYHVFCANHLAKATGGVYIIYDDELKFVALLSSQSSSTIVPAALKNAFGEYEDATTTEHGLMSASDKIKLNSLKDSILDEVIVSETASAIQLSFYNTGGEMSCDVGIPTASTDNAGVMSAADKASFDKMKAFLIKIGYTE